MLAVEANSPSMIKSLLEKGANIKQPMSSGWMAIHYAVRLGHESCVLALLAVEVRAVLSWQAPPMNLGSAVGVQKHAGECAGT